MKQLFSLTLFALSALFFSQTLTAALPGLTVLKRFTNVDDATVEFMAGEFHQIVQRLKVLEGSKGKRLPYKSILRQVDSDGRLAKLTNDYVRRIDNPSYAGIPWKEKTRQADFLAHYKGNVLTAARRSENWRRLIKADVIDDEAVATAYLNERLAYKIAGEPDTASTSGTWGRVSSSESKARRSSVSSTSSSDGEGFDLSALLPKETKRKLERSQISRKTKHTATTGGSGGGTGTKAKTPKAAAAAAPKQTGTAASKRAGAAASKRAGAGKGTRRKAIARGKNKQLPTEGSRARTTFGAFLDAAETGGDS